MSQSEAVEKIVSAVAEAVDGLKSKAKLDVLAEVKSHLQDQIDDLEDETANDEQAAPTPTQAAPVDPAGAPTPTPAAD